MEKLDDSLFLEILSRLNDPADIARSRVASKALDTVFPDLRSVNLQCSFELYLRLKSSVSSSSETMKTVKTVFLDFISKLRVVESVCISIEKPIPGVPHCVDKVDDDLFLTDGDFVNKWLPRVSETLKSLSISNFFYRVNIRRSNLLSLVSTQCRNLVELKVMYTWLSVENLNPMPMLTSLTLVYTRLEDEQLNELNKCFPNLQVLNLVRVRGLENPRIHLLKLKTCCWIAVNAWPSLTVITPNLITLRVKCLLPNALLVEAPMLSHFHLRVSRADPIMVNKFENLKTLWLESEKIGFLLSKFPITKTVENLTVYSRNQAPGAGDSELSLNQVFTVFPYASSLCINSTAWLELEACLNPQGWELFDGRKGLKTFSAYLSRVDPSLTISTVACLLTQSMVLSELSFFIQDDVVGNVSKSFMSK